MSSDRLRLSVEERKKIPATCPICSKQFDNVYKMSAHKSHCLHDKPRTEHLKQWQIAPWNKGLTKETSKSIARSALNISIKLRGKPGHLHTLETRQKMSQSASERSFGNNARVSWYQVANTLGDVFNVQGTWEKRFAEWLNQQKIPWERPKTTFSWRRNDDDILHAYHPDFFLPDTGSFVEIKGYMWKDKDKKIDDELKLQLVMQQNPNLVLIVLMKNDLQEMGVISVTGRRSSDRRTIALRPKQRPDIGQQREVRQRQTASSESLRPWVRVPPSRLDDDRRYVPS